MRGLKLRKNVSVVRLTLVARSTRAWIETSTALIEYSSERVARSTRAWIETDVATSIPSSFAVARSTRAWIETC